MPTSNPPAPSDPDEFELEDAAAPEPIRLKPERSASPNSPTRPPTPNDEDDDYELEAPDETITELARQRAKQELVEANEALAIDEAQQAMEERHTLDTEVDFKFQFQVKHLLLATTVVSIAFSLSALLNANGVAVLIVMTTLGLVATHAYLNWSEQKRVNEASAKRAAAIRRVRERQAANQRGEEFTMYDEELEQADAEFAEAVEDNRFKLNFSLRNMLIAITIAAVVLGLGSLLGFKVLALLLGVVAISGMAAYGLGVQPPPTVVMVWWVTLVLYIVMCVGRAVGVFGETG